MAAGNGQKNYLKLKHKQNRLLVIPLGEFWSYNFNWFSADWVIVYPVRADLFCWLFSRYKKNISLVKKNNFKDNDYFPKWQINFVSKKNYPSILLSFQCYPEAQMNFELDSSPYCFPHYEKINWHTFTIIARVTFLTF